VLACVPAELAARVTSTLAIPTIGIGAGPHCDGQVLVTLDLLGLFDELRPRFVKQYADLGREERTTRLGRHPVTERPREQQRRRVNRSQERTIETNDGTQPCQETVAEHRRLSRGRAPTNHALLGTATDRHTLRMARMSGRATPRN